MNVSITIVGQGIAGTMLGAACERAGIDFEVIDAGHAEAASRVGAGLVSPLTGRRLVPTWRFTEWRDHVWEIYRHWESELGLSLVRELKVHRRFCDRAQRLSFESRCAVPEVARWVADQDEDGLWLRGALQVETGQLIRAMRQRWQRAGRLTEAKLDPAADHGPSRPTIWCVGGAVAAALDLPWQPSRGELIRGYMAGLDPDTVRNDGHWLLPSASGEVRVGSTFDRHKLDLETTVAGQSELAAAAERLGGQMLQQARGDVGLRVTVPDRRPVVGWWNANQTKGVLGGMAAKGALWAPMLAQQWCEDRMIGAKLDTEARVERFPAARPGLL
ncbi:MAG: NAD(P)/FAD-dependent oxidoreductase [bacterium]